MKKLVVFDGNAILHRAYHALPPLTTKSGEPINAVYGLVSMLLKVIQDLTPSHIVVCFDRVEPTFRKIEYEAYQAQRPVMDGQLSSQFEKARDTLKAFNIPFYSKAGFEADDLIGTIASKVISDKRVEKSNKNLAVDEVVIVTGDKDILQLVDKNVKVYMPVRGMSEGKLMQESDVVEKLGVTPSQIPDFKGLVGDPSDNYPGVTGIGPKTATNLIKEYGQMEIIYGNLSKITPAVAKKLTEGEKNARISYRLATIIKDVDFDFSLEEAAKWKIDSAQVLDLFAQYGFRTLTERVKKVGKELENEKQLTLI